MKMSDTTSSKTSGSAAPVVQFSERFNMADYFLDARVREGHGDRTAVIVDDARYSYRDVLAQANQAGNLLRAHGIDIEDRVLLLLPDGIAFVAAFFGILKAGATFCMGNPMSTTEDLAYLLDYTRARAVVTDHSTLDRLTPALQGNVRCRARFVVGGDAEGFEPWEESLRQQSSATMNADTLAEDVAGWLFTSGTTGKPKGAVHLHRHFAFSTECYAKGVLGLRPDDVFVSVSRLFFGYATGTNLMFPFAVGGTAVLFPEKPTAERIFDQIGRHGVTVLTNVPAMLRQMIDSDAADQADLSSVRICLSAGEALPAELHDRWRRRWPGVEILDGIGSAEMFHIYISNRPGDVTPGSLGKVVPGYQVRIVGPDGQDVAVGEMGRLWVKGDSAGLGYWGDQAKSQEVFQGPWVITADLFRRDAEGRYYYAGRTDDMLKVRGMFVSPLEIEDSLARHPAVEECAVVGVDDGEGLTVPKAFVVVRNGHDPTQELGAALQAHVKSELTRYKFPRMIEFLDRLPRNDRGKILRRELGQ